VNSEPTVCSTQLVIVVTNMEVTSSPKTSWPAVIKLFFFQIAGMRVQNSLLASLSVPSIIVGPTVACKAGLSYTGAFLQRTKWLLMRA